MHGREIVLRFPAEVKNISVLHGAKTPGDEAHFYFIPKIKMRGAIPPVYHTLS
jgi:hypothetical protein